jgi:hypothetical protein
LTTNTKRDNSNSEDEIHWKQAKNAFLADEIPPKATAANTNITCTPWIAQRI